MRFTRKPLLVLALMGAVIAVPALAQQPAAYPPACDGSKVSKSDVERAHTVFLSGKQYLEESNYEKAISYFKDAYSIDCSVHPILPIIATAYERKGDKGEAVRALQEYQKRVPAAPDHDVVERRIRNLQDQLAHEQPSATAQPSSSATAATTPSVSADSTRPASSSAPTSSTSSSPAPGSHSALPWVVVGIGGAAIAGGVVLYALGSGDVSSAQNACPSRINCAKSIADQGNSGRSQETIGGVVIGVGAAGVAAGLVWHFVERPAESPSVARVSPVVAPGYAGLAFGGAF